MRPHDTAPRGGSRGSGNFVNGFTGSDERGGKIVSFTRRVVQWPRQRPNTPRAQPQRLIRCCARCRSHFEQTAAHHMLCRPCFHWARAGLLLFAAAQAISEAS